MDYQGTFKTEGEKTVAPLADRREDIRKQLDSLRKQFDREKENGVALEGRLSRLKAAAGETLTGGQNRYEKFRRDIQRLTVAMAGSKEMVGNLAELIEAKQGELVKVESAVQAALLKVAEQVRGACEHAMAALIGGVLAERDRYMAAAESVFADYGGDFTGRFRVYADGVHYRPDPSRRDFLIGTGLDETLIDGQSTRARRGPYLSAPVEPQAEPQAAPSTDNANEPPQDAPQRILTGLSSSPERQSPVEGPQATLAAVLGVNDEP